MRILRDETWPIYATGQRPIDRIEDAAFKTALHLLAEQGKAGAVKRDSKQSTSQDEIITWTSIKS